MVYLFVLFGRIQSVYSFCLGFRRATWAVNCHNRILLHVPIVRESNASSKEHMNRVVVGSESCGLC